MRKVIAVDDKLSAIEKLTIREIPRNNLMILLDAISILNSQNAELSNDNLVKQSGLSKGQIATVKKNLQKNNIDAERLLGLPKKEKKQSDHFLVQYRLKNANKKPQASKRRRKKAEPVNVEELSNASGLSKKTLTTLLANEDNLETIQILAKRVENNRIKKGHYLYLNLYLDLFIQSINSNSESLDKSLEELEAKLENIKDDKQLLKVEIGLRRIKQLTTQVARIKQAYRTYRTDILASEFSVLNRLVHSMGIDVQKEDRQTYDLLVKLNKTVHTEYN